MLSNEKPPLDTESLLTILEIPLSALNTNKAGLFSGGQRESLQEEVKQEADGMSTMLTIMLAGAVVAAIALASSGSDMMPVILGAAIMILPFLWYSSRRQQRLRTELERPKIKSVHGPLLLADGADVRSRMRAPMMRIGDQIFPLKIHQVRALESFETPYVRAYYVGNTNQLLSIEVIDPPLEYIEQEKAKRKNEEAAEQARLLEEGSRDYEEEASDADHPLRQRRDDR